MSYGNVIMSSGWDTLPFLSHPDEIANFDFPQHAVALQRFFVATIHLKFIGFNTIKFLQPENIFVLAEALRYHKQLSTSLIAVGDIIIGKSFDKLVKARDVKVSTKRWRDRS